MAITLITTPKATDANSYASVAEADAYHETHLYASAWTSETDERKKAALVWATRMLDNELEFNGWPTTVEQKLRWPRQGIWTRDNIDVDEDTIPEFVQFATAELARLLLVQDRTAEPDTKGFSAIRVGPISLNIDRHDSTLAPIPDSVMSFLVDHSKFASSSRFVKVERT